MELISGTSLIEFTKVLCEDRDYVALNELYHQLSAKMVAESMLPVYQYQEGISPDNIYVKEMYRCGYDFKFVDDNGQKLLFANMAKAVEGSPESLTNNISIYAIFLSLTLLKEAPELFSIYSRNNIVLIGADDVKAWSSNGIVKLILNKYLKNNDIARWFKLLNSLSESPVDESTIEKASQDTEEEAPEPEQTSKSIQTEFKDKKSGKKKKKGAASKYDNDVKSFETNNNPQNITASVKSPELETDSVSNKENISRVGVIFKSLQDGDSEDNSLTNIGIPFSVSKDVPKNDTEGVPFDDYTNTALHLAIRNGNIEMVRHLMLRGVPYKEYKPSPLSYAIELNAGDIVKLFITEGYFDVDEPDDRLESPLFYAIVHKNQIAIDFLLASGANPLMGTQNEPSLFHLACKKGNLDIIMALTVNLRGDKATIAAIVDFAENECSEEVGALLRETFTRMFKPTPQYQVPAKPAVETATPKVFVPEPESIIKPEIKPEPISVETISEPEPEIEPKQKQEIEVEEFSIEEEVNPTQDVSTVDEPIDEEPTIEENTIEEEPIIEFKELLAEDELVSEVLIDEPSLFTPVKDMYIEEEDVKQTKEDKQEETIPQKQKKQKKDKQKHTEKTKSDYYSTDCVLNTEKYSDDYSGCIFITPPYSIDDIKTLNLDIDALSGVEVIKKEKMLPFEACHIGDIDALMSSGLSSGSVNFKNKLGYTMLHIASLYGYTDIAKYLISLGANVDIKDGERSKLIDIFSKSSELPIHYAAAAGNTEIVELLISAKASVKAVDYSYYTPLHYAAMQGNKKMIIDIIGAGASVSARDDDGNEPLLFAIDRSDIDTIGILIDEGAKINSANNFGETPILRAVKSGNIDMVLYLLDRGADINVRDCQYRNTLHIALEYGHKHIVKHLIDRGADCEAKNNRDLAPRDLM